MMYFLESVNCFFWGRYMDAYEGRKRLMQLWDRLYSREHVNREDLPVFLETSRRKPHACQVCSSSGDAFSESSGQNRSSLGVNPVPGDVPADKTERLKSVGVLTLWIRPLLKKGGGCVVADFGLNHGSNDHPREDRLAGAISGATEYLPCRRGEYEE